MLGCCRVLPAFPNHSFRRGFCCRAEDQQPVYTERQNKKKVVVVGSGWAGLGAANHLCKQGFDVTVLEGGYEFGYKNKSLSPDDYGIRGFWYPYRNIFNLVDEIDVKPFTSWTKSAQYSEEGLEVEYPIYKDALQLPTPFGTLFNTQFVRLPLIDQLTSLPVMAAVIDFDNTDAAWRKYDAITARELLKRFGCSERLYRDVFDPLLQVGLFAPAEQCSAAATIGMLYYFVLANQKHFDLVLCRGTIREQIFQPWIESLKTQGCRFLEGRKVTDVTLDEETGCITEVVCGKESFKVDAVILAVGISTLQEIVQNSAVLCTREEFLKIMNLNSIDLLTVKVELDRKVNLSNASNVSCGFEGSCAWTFFDLSMIYDKEKSYVTGLEAANRIIDYLKEGTFAKILPVQEDEPHIQSLRILNRNLNDIIEQLPWSNYFLRNSKYLPTILEIEDQVAVSALSTGQQLKRKGNCTDHAVFN
ncbi:uncharacterized protein LOC111411409 [Olea europaea var. sylvestris]|uniref:uncharacterized protein LOC111411409 n=1 Tax=Olea europaea var. sylvestris TaxID=158386 RepID=UPI000C1D1A01|nr:uncharacterized protein LOC111411409 [Olea europaea var. sylvestris]